MASSLGSAGSTTEWRKTRAQVLEEEPDCRACGRPSTEVDHIIERQHGGDDRRENLQALCKPCHAAKSARHARGRGGLAGGGYPPPSRDW